MTDWRVTRDQLLVALQHERSPQRRAEAAAELVHLAAADESRWPELSPEIPRLLDDRQPEVRRSVLQLAAWTLPPEEARPLLESRLRDPDATVRMEATGQLADQARLECRPALAVALGDDAFLVRFEAARGMAALHHAAGFDVLVEALDNRDLRFRAIGALAQLGDARALPAIRRIFGRWLLPHFERTQAAGALVKLGDLSGAVHLLARTRTRWSVDRAFAIELCGELRLEGARERLLEILNDRSDAARGAAARGLGRMGDPALFETLAVVLEEKGAPDELKLDIAEGLMRLRTPESRARVERAMESFTSAEARLELRGMLEELA